MSGKIRSIGFSDGLGMRIHTLLFYDTKLENNPMIVEIYMRLS